MPDLRAQRLRLLFFCQPLQGVEEEEPLQLCPAAQLCPEEEEPPQLCRPGTRFVEDRLLFLLLLPGGGNAGGLGPGGSQ